MDGLLDRLVDSRICVERFRKEVELLDTLDHLCDTYAAAELSFEKFRLYVCRLKDRNSGVGVPLHSTTAKQYLIMSIQFLIIIQEY